LATITVGRRTQGRTFRLRGRTTSRRQKYRHRLAPFDTLAHMPWTLAQLESALAAPLPPEPAHWASARRSAVAIVLRFTAEGPHVLLMQRAAREGDRWSGQVSFPGGRAEPHDLDLLHTARRETLEEVGLDLATHGRPLGRLPTRQAVARGGPLDLTISPFVFAQERDADFTLSEEATRAFWLPLPLAQSGALDAPFEYSRGDAIFKLPSWRYDGHTIWGMTFEMLRALMGLR